MKTTINSLCRSLLVLVLACSAANVFGQQLRYECTRYMDSTGRDEPSSGVSLWEFSGTMLRRDLGMGMKATYQFHHKDGSNSVYYRLVQNFMPYSMGSPRNDLNCNDVMVVSADRNLLNQIHYQSHNINVQGSWSNTYVYKRSDGQSHSQMYQ